MVLRSEGKHRAIGMDVSVIAQMAREQYQPYAEHLGAAQRMLDWGFLTEVVAKEKLAQAGAHLGK